MARKKRGSSADEVMLVPVVPARRRRIRVYGGLGAALLLVVAFVAGDISGREGERAAERERDRLASEVSELQDKLKAARDELALHRTSAEMADQAQAQVRQEIRTLRDQVAELEEAVSFYKNVMAPGSDEEGLHIEKLAMAPADEPHTYDYKLVLTQLGNNRAYLSGQVQLQFTGQLEGKEVSLGGELLSDNSETGFRFRYFQELTGRVRLPEGMAPSRIKVEAVATGRRRDRAERDFTWQLQENNGAGTG